MIRVIKITLYILFLGSLAGNWILHDAPGFLWGWSKGRFVNELNYDVRRLSQYLENYNFTTVSEIATFDNSIVRNQGSNLEDLKALDRRESRMALLPLGLEFFRAHHIFFMGRLHLFYDITQIFMPGILSIVPVEKDGDIGVLVVGRGTFVRVPLVIFAYRGEIVHVAYSNEAALDYFIEHWQ